jgi:hypothetical protein
VFWPWVPGAKPGSPLYAKQGDLVTWNNMSSKKITLVSIPKGTYLTEPIPSGKVSSPAFSVPQKGIAYGTADGKYKHSIKTSSPPSV